MAWTGVRPQRSDDWTAEQWVNWLTTNCEILPVAGWEGPTCAYCWVPSQLDGSGRPYRQCYKCLATKLNAHVYACSPIAFGTFDGLTGLIRQYKDGSTWLVRPLAALLGLHLSYHLQHLRRATTEFSVATWIPSHSARPGGDHLRRVIDEADLPSSLDIRPGILRKVAIDSAGRQFHPHAFEAESVGRATVLLIDDVLTTGGTMASAAWALRDADASSIVGLALARHLNPAYYDHHARLIANQRLQGFEIATCQHE